MTESPTILAIETSSEVCSAALYQQGECTQKIHHKPRQHAALILPSVDNLLQEAGTHLGEIEGMAVANGPGSFTGIRIAVGVVQGLAYAARCPVVTVSTLQVLALQAARAHGKPANFLVCLDARKQEVYWGVFSTAKSELPEQVGALQVGPAKDVDIDPLVNDCEAWVGVGSGWINDGATLMAATGVTFAHIYAELAPEAKDVAALSVTSFLAGGGISPDKVFPLYLRDDVVG